MVPPGWIEPVLTNPEDQTVFEWTEEDKQALYTHFDLLYDLGAETDNLPAIEDAIGRYRSQMSEGQEPSKVLTRIFNYTERLTQ